MISIFPKRIQEKICKQVGKNEQIQLNHKAELSAEWEYFQVESLKNLFQNEEVLVFI